MKKNAFNKCNTKRTGSTFSFWSDRHLLCVSGQYMLEQRIITCVASPHQQPTRNRRSPDEPVFVDNSTTEKGKAYIYANGMIMLREKVAFLHFVRVCFWLLLLVWKIAPGKYAR